jgi:hypothetical protein
MKTFLILDDQEEQHDQFRSRLFSMFGACKSTGDFDFFGDVIVLHVKSSMEAIMALRNIYFDFVTLDHDLGGSDKGMKVAEFICNMNPENHPKIVCVHSMNFPAGLAMQRKLLDSGIHCVRETI